MQKPGESHSQERNADDPPQNLKRDHLTMRGGQNQCSCDGQCMTNGKLSKCGPDRPPAAILTPACDSEKPSHCGVDPVRSAEREQHEPGVRRILHRHSA
jgi:hypothetical protein